MSNRRSSTNLLHPTTAFCFDGLVHFDVPTKALETAWRIFYGRSFFAKKLSKMSRTRPRSPHCVLERAHGNAHVAFARGHGADAASEDAQERGRRERREPRGPRDPIAEGHLARREIARRRPEGAKLRVVQQRVAVRVLRRVVKALAERGYHKCVSLSRVARRSRRSPDVVVARPRTRVV